MRRKGIRDAHWRTLGRLRLFRFIMQYRTVQFLAERNYVMFG